MKTRTDVPDKFKQFIADYQAPQTIVTDGAKEFTSETFEEICREKGVRHEISSPYTPEENGKSERLWSTLMNTTRCLLSSANMPNTFWTYALNHAVFVKNRCIHSSIDCTPFELMFGYQPDLKDVRVFGSLAFAYVEKQFRSKLDQRAEPCLFLGYKPKSNCSIVAIYNSSLGPSIRVTRNVKVIEKPFFTSKYSPYSTSLQLRLDSTEQMEHHDLVPAAIPQPSLADDVDIQDESDNQIDQQTPDATVTENNDETPTSSQVTDDSEGNLWRSTRRRKPPDFYGIPIQSSVVEEALYSAPDTSLPIDTEDALAKRHWKEAMEKEVHSLRQLRVWDLVDKPESANVIDSKWHFSIKRDDSGAISRYKARFVAKGFAQRFGEDYFETFSPTCRLSTIRLILNFAAQSGCQIKQLDVKTAYLYAPIDTDVYIQQPKGFEVRDGNGKLKVCKLLKSIYGLKQSGRNWHLALKSHLETLGLTSSNNDPALFFSVNNHRKCLVAAWVDDIVYTSNDPDFVSTFERHITKRFTVSECSDLRWFLGMQINVTKNHIHVNQKQCIEDMLISYNMVDCKTFPTPLPEKITLTRGDSTEDNKEMSDKPYRALVGSLNYLASTCRPDIAYAAHTLSSFLEKPGLPHWNAAKHVLRYLKGTKNFGLFFRHHPDGITLTGCSDANWGGNVDNMKSTSGFCFFLNDASGAISWMSKLQSTVATSTAEAELLACHAAALEMQYFSNLLNELHIVSNTPSILLCDNQAAIALCSISLKHGMTKHFAVKVSFIRDCLEKKLFTLSYQPSEHMIADTLTKPLGPTKCSRFVKKLLGVA